jgi:pimeloyl-ACP methyl ester carboxylesterase
MGAEMSALVSLALTTPLRWLLPEEGFDPTAPHPTPVLLVHGLLGDPTNFLVLRRFLVARGVRNLYSFSYRPRIDHRQLAAELGDTIEVVCRATGVARVDVVGYSLGGLVARYLIETSAGRRVRRMVSVGAPYFTHSIPEQELAVFGAGDPLVPAPHPVYGPHGRIRIVPDCGHLALLHHPTVLHEVARYLTRPVELAAVRSGAIGTRVTPLRRSSRQLALCPTKPFPRVSPTIRPSPTVTVRSP